MSTAEMRRQITAEEGAAPDVVAALRAELALVSKERDGLREELRGAKVKEQLLLTRVAELEAKYEPNAVRSPTFKKAFGPGGGNALAADALLERVFTEPGSMGLKLNEVEGTGRAKIVKVNPGTQGEQHPQTVGMLVKSVAGTDVSAMTYKEVLGLLKSKAKERPLTLQFEAVPQEPAPEAEPEPEPPTGGRPRSMSKASKKPKGDTDEETKRRQRQFSLSHPDFAPPPASAAAAPAAQAPAPAPAGKVKVSRRTSVYTESHPDFAAAAAAALVDEESEEDEMPGQ
jgi:hypothetical protein